MMNKKNIVFRAIAFLVCVIMIASLIACNSASDAEPSDETAATAENENMAMLSSEEITPVGNSQVTSDSSVETMKVVVFASNSYKGNRMTETSVTLADVPITDLPLDPVTSIDNVVGKYLAVNAKKGECVASSMLTLTNPYINVTGLGKDYVLISNYISDDPTEQDMSVIIQRAIDENPGKTIYFPDGKYNMSKTVIIPSAEGKGVSFRLSNYAILGPSTSWDDTCTALVQYGAESDSKPDAGVHSNYIMGGAFECNARLTAIEINGGGRLFVNNVSIKNAKLGIHLKTNAAYNTVENVNITANSANSTKGVFVEGTNNTLINMRIYRVLVGVHLTGGDNVLINIHPLFSGTNSINAIAFNDESTGNRYNICYSDQFMVGFKLASHTRSHFDSCYAYWWQAISNEIGFLCEGEFNSIITDTFINFTNVNNNTQSHYIYFLGEETESENDETETETETESETRKRPGRPGSSQTEAAVVIPEGEPSGSGKIVNPSIIASKNSDSDTYKQFIYNYD